MSDPPRAAHRTETVRIGADDCRPAPCEHLAAGTRIADRYELIEVLGSGGFGVVYLARDLRADRRVALKVLRADRLGEGALKRFAREAALARGIESPHLIRIFDSGVGDDGVFLVMEVVEGESLATRLERGPLPVAEAVRVAGGLLAGLAALHAVGVVHRDVKPSNVLLGPDGRAKLADFGLARQEGSEETRATASDVLMGTVEYLAPERALGEEAGCLSDLYAAGVVLFEMLTGDVPLRARSSLGTLLAHVQRPAPDLHRLHPDVPVWLSAVVGRLLAKDPAERYPRAEDVLRDLREARRPRRASRPGWRGRWSWRGRVGTAACALLLTLAVGAATLRGGRSADRLVQVAEHERSIAGIGSGGRTLWEIPGKVGTLHRAHLKPGEPERLVGFLVPPGGRDPGEWHTLSVLDPATGRVVRTVRLPDDAPAFSGFSDRYTAQVRVQDLDGDGLDELLVTYLHEPYWPSYLVLYEPLLERSRVLLRSSGHHRVRAAVDLDGDGVEELVLRGINNRMGYSSTAAALRIEPPVNRPGPPRDVIMAATPDTTSGEATRRRPALVWYALLPRTVTSQAGDMAVDRKARTLSFPRAGEAPFVLDFDGFRAGARSALPPAERERLRRGAYDHLREARRLGEVGYGDESVTESVSAADLARRSGDPVLEEYVRRIQGQLLARAGRPAEADALFARVAASSSEAPEVAFDAARAFHLAGDLERAVRWYRVGLGPGGTEALGRAKYEFLEGLVFALTDLGRPEEAYGEVKRYEAAERAERGQRATDWPVLEEYVRWRAGRRPEALPVPKATSPDLFRYLPLEYQAAQGAPPARVLAGVRRELARSSDTTGMLLSLEAEELERLGRHREALEEAQRGYEWARAERSEQVYAHTFFSRIEARYHQLARTADASRVRTARAHPGEAPPVVVAAAGPPHP